MQHPTGSAGFVLEGHESEPVEVVSPEGRAPLVLVCEHGGRAVPRCLAAGAPDTADMERHIAWDVGAAAVARHMADCLDAPLAIQPYSRLVIDCNRPRHAADLMPALCDGTTVPFNRHVGEMEREARWQAIHRPFHAEVARLIDIRPQPVAVVAVHSFTPRMRNGAPRPWHVGLLARKDGRLSEAIADSLQTAAPDLCVAINEPYRIEDDSDFTIPRHAEARGLPHVLIEVRNDLVSDPGGVERWAGRLSTALREAIPRILA